MACQEECGKTLARLAGLEEILMRDYGMRQLEVMEGVEALRSGVFPESVAERQGDAGFLKKAGEFAALCGEASVEDPVFRDERAYLSCFGVPPEERDSFARRAGSLLAGAEGARKRAPWPELPFDPGLTLESFASGYGPKEAKEEIIRAVGVLRGSGKVRRAASEDRDLFFNEALKVMAEEMVRAPEMYGSLFETAVLTAFLDGLCGHRELLEEEKC